MFWRWQVACDDYPEDFQHILGHIYRAVVTAVLRLFSVWNFEIRSLCKTADVGPKFSTFTLLPPCRALFHFAQIWYIWVRYGSAEVAQGLNSTYREIQVGVPGPPPLGALLNCLISFKFCSRLYRGSGKRRELPSGVRGRAPAENGFWRILKANGLFVPMTKS